MFLRYEVIRIHANTREQLDPIIRLALEDPEFDIWKADLLVGSTDIMAPAHRVNDLTQFLKNREISHATMIKNVEL